MLGPKCARKTVTQNGSKMDYFRMETMITPMVSEGAADGWLPTTSTQQRKHVKNRRPAMAAP